MISLFSALSKFVVTVTPFVVLPITLVFGVNIALKLSTLFLIYNLIVASIRYFSKTLWDTISFLTEVPLMIIVIVAGFYVLPDSVVNVYKHSLDWSGPILVIVEGIQITRVITLSGKRLVRLIDEHPDYLTLLKVIVIGGSLICYVVSSYLSYNLYTSPAMNVPFASFVSATITVVLILNVVSIFMDGAVLSDAALLLVYILLSCRFSLLQFSNTFAAEHVTHSGYFSYYLGKFSLPTTPIFTLDYVLSSLLSGLALFTLSFPNEILEEDDASSEPEKSIIWEIVKDASFKILAVTLYTHLILQLVGLSCGEFYKSF